MVTIGMLPKEQDFRQLKSRQEALEIQCAYMSEVVTWLANHQGGNFTPPARNYTEARSSQAAKGRVTVDLTKPAPHQVTSCSVFLTVFRGRR